MTPEEIKGRMKEKKLSQRRLARRIRLSPTAVNMFVNGQLTSEKLEKRIARVLELTVDELKVLPQ
jgi:transcriptional regulator with XRE-family HTH domain